MWAFGLALVVLSLYAPIGVPIVVDRRAGAPSRPAIAVFAAPGPFVGPAGERQGLAVRSWLSLSSQVTVVLFTRDEFAVTFARKLGSRVVVEPEVDFSVLRFLEKRILHLWGNKNLVSRAEDCIAIGNAYDWAQKDEPASIHFPFSLKSLLMALAYNNNTVILGVAGYSYKDMLMSWVCRLRAFRITNFVGLPVFKDQSAPSEIGFDDCHFGTECFQKVTKVESRIVTKILKLGYNVLMSDADVYWFQNPLPYISSFGPAVLLAQSDEYNETGPMNMPRL